MVLIQAEKIIKTFHQQWALVWFKFVEGTVIVLWKSLGAYHVEGCLVHTS